MKVIHSIRIVLLGILIMSSFSMASVSAEDLTTSDASVIKLITNTNVITAKSKEWFTYQTFGNNDPLQPSSVTIISDKDGNFVGNATKNVGNNWETVVEIKDKNWNITTVTMDASGNWSGDPGAASLAAGMSTASNQNTVITTEKVPGANCECAPWAGDCTDITTRKYLCTSGKGLSAFQEVVAQIVRYVVNITLLLGVLAVVGLGIAWSFAGGDDIKMKSALKKWAFNIIVGFVILFMFWYILRLLAPWVYM